MLTIFPEKQHPDAIRLCAAFCRASIGPKYVLGRNEYAASIAEFIELDGFIDDFTHETEWLGKPVLKTEEIPKNSMVVSVNVLGRPLIALKRLERHGVACLDYFKFLKYSGLAVKEIKSLRDDKCDIENNMEKYQWLYNRLADDASRDVLENLVNFKISSDLDYMRGFEHAPDRQYFEDFLDLKPGEVFVDAGGFDGQTTIEFIKRCPGYQSAYIFEPDPVNLEAAKKNLAGKKDVYFYARGLAENQKILRFCSGDGSSSKICDTGDVEIHVDALDNLVKEPVSFVKMDIEGAEGIALDGAKTHILADHPKLAICCYHKPDDFWRLPTQVLAMSDDYAIYMRHYTEGLTETVMYFIP
jgi:FkbM family methyltransferase